MFPQITFVLKSVSADFAALRRRLSRQLGVLFDTRTVLHLRVWRRLIALVDLQRVTPAVCLQGTALDEGLPAAVTNVWSLSRVDLLMASQRSGSGEAFVTDGAAVRFDPRVASHVRLHILEPFATDAAGAAGLSVRLQVSQQTVGRVHFLSTDAANARGFSAVRLGVFPQESSAVEGVSADSAAE